MSLAAMRIQVAAQQSAYSVRLILRCQFHSPYCTSLLVVFLCIRFACCAHFFAGRVFVLFVVFWFRLPWECMLQLNSRWTKFLSVTVPFVTRVVKDYTSGNIMKNEGELARDLRIVIEKLGPTFIKARFCSR